MFDRLKKWWAGDPDPADNHHGPLRETHPGDWVVLPYRLAEACRISMSTVGSHPDIPDDVRLWIAHWLQTYNMSLANYFRENYGPNIFPILEQITFEVWKLNEKNHSQQGDEVLQSSFEMWEEELGGREHPNPPPTG